MAAFQEEVEDWLAHIPVFAVTDSKGSGVILRPDNETSVFYFFMSPMMANATLETLKSSNENMDLRISAFSLGKVWFKVLNADNSTEVMVSGKENVTFDVTTTISSEGNPYSLVFLAGYEYATKYLVKATRW